MAAVNPSDEREYKRRIRAWTLYDWANSAFATTVLAAVLPIYYSQVAGANLPNEATATSYWSLTLSIALLIAAITSPILGTVSDIMRGKKRFLAIFTAIGVVGTSALVFVGTGDWLLASIIMIVARVGFTGAYTFYDALLPHVAREEDRDAVSTRGYAMGYLGGGLLLAINVVMIFQLGFENGARLSFLSVALWWIVFSIPIFRDVPEPSAAVEKVEGMGAVVSASFERIRETIRDMRRYRELFKFLIAFLIYNDAIGTIIGVAAIYGTELGFDATELILALLLVQFAGIPFSLIFGWLPSKQRAHRPFYLAFILFNLVALPVAGILGAQVDAESMTLPVIIGILVGLQLIGLVFAWFIGQRFVGGMVDRLDTKSSILLALVFYSVIAIWGFVLRSPIEFWFLAWLVAIVQGGSQALSRSLYAAMSPASKSGEFFGLFGVMENSSFLGPLLFALAVALFGSSRPAILALISFFIVGGYLLTKVNVEVGRQVAQAEDAALSQ